MSADEELAVLFVVVLGVTVIVSLFVLISKLIGG